MNKKHFGHIYIKKTTKEEVFLLERILSQEERIRRAEEIYNRRKRVNRSKGFF